MFGKLHDKVHKLGGQVQDRLTERLHRQEGEGQHAGPPPVPPHPNSQQQQHCAPGVPPRPAVGNPEAFAILRRRWLKQTLGDFDSVAMKDPAMQENIKALSWQAKKLLDTYVDDKKDRVFTNAGPLCCGDMKFKATWLRLFQIASAWATPGTAQYQNSEVLAKVISGIDFVHDTFYNSQNQDLKRAVEKRENWWALQIGGPLNLADMCVVVYDALGPERRRKIGQAVVDTVGATAKPSLKGGNRAWIARVLVITGLYMDSPEVVKRGIATLSAEGGSAEVRKCTVFDYVRAGDGEGLYPDGSLISHDIYPYAGGYGLQMLTSVAYLLNLLNSPESPPEYRITDPGAAIIYDSVERNFLPVVWQGIIFEHVRGREVSRADGPGWTNGHLLIHGAALLATGCSDQQRASEIASYVRLWQSMTPYSALPKATIAQAALLQSVLDSPDTGPAPHPRGAFATPIQEHFVYHSPDANWCFTLSLCSKRIGRAETLKGENSKSWYQGDGMTYLYTSTHKTHFGDDYWPTMDPLHCPGTTNHQTEPPPPEYKKPGFRDWSGGACWAGGGGGNGVAYGSRGNGARFAAVSMDHCAEDWHSKAKKSWFMLEDGIIALGAGVFGNLRPNPSNMHTTIESRNLDEPGRALWINGVEYKNPAGWSKSSDRVHWAWLENTGGYIFLDQTEQELRSRGEVPASLPKIFSRTKRCGRWKDINGDGKPDEICREYVNIVLDHGPNPNTSAYAYAILPLASKETTEELMKGPHWKVFRNTVEVQAIENRFDQGEVTMVTFWVPGEVNGVKAEQGCQLIWGRWKGEWCLTVSDPTFLTKTIAVNVEVITARGLKLGRKDEGVEVQGSRVVFNGMKEGAAKSVFFSGGVAGHDEL
ncbi:Chondroitinase-AC [Dactylellina cionopaga]|nr:Chondroitinase-AC [Dactylellina cionopaga]